MDGLGQQDAVDAGRAREEVGNGRLKEVEAELAAYLARRTQERDEAEAAQVCPQSIQSRCAQMQARGRFALCCATCSYVYDGGFFVVRLMLPGCLNGIHVDRTWEIEPSVLWAVVCAGAGDE